MEERAYWVALRHIPQLGARETAELVGRLGSARAVWEAPPDLLEGLGTLAPALLQALVAKRPTLEPERLWEGILARGIQALTLLDALYPRDLLSIYDPPPVLFVRGALPPPGALCLAVVGARRATAYGRRVAEEMGFSLAAAGAWVVSGLARGIDSCAHRGALKAGGKTLAVLGCGVDVIYPPEHKNLVEEIAGGGGAVLSELLPGTQPLPQHFPARNRIISGLCSATVVVEAGEKSGALITAGLALEQGRDVFAVPGPVTSPLSKGANRLLKEGAGVAESAADLLADYGLKLEAKEAAGEGGPVLSEQEKEILAILAGEPVQAEELAERLGTSPQELNALLLFLELKDLVRQLPGRFYLATSLAGKSWPR